MVASFIDFGSVLVFRTLVLDRFFKDSGLGFSGLLDFGFSDTGFCDPSNQSTDDTNLILTPRRYKSTNAVFWVFINYRRS